MAAQRTLVLLKPDAVQRNLVGDIISRFERKGYLIVAMKLIVPSQDIAAKHYHEHAQKPFFQSLLKFITGGPVVAMALDGDEGIAVMRNLVGATDGRKAAPGTIRGDFGISKSANLIHASDSPESAERELKIWFPEGFVRWSRCDTPWLDAE
jgi:nucleoside-diphosphate kinase